MDLIEKLKNTILFENIEEKDIRALTFCLNTKVKTFPQNYVIAYEEDVISSAYLILKGKCKAVKEDASNNNTIIMTYESGDVFGIDSLNNYPSNYTYITLTECKILVMDKFKIISPCSNMCKRHITLMQNIMNILSNINAKLRNQLINISNRSIRQKVMHYLKKYEKTPNEFFDVPLNRQEMADYLIVDRSALSKELSKLKEENVIEYKKNHFKINR